jgi:probable HAF family extracellular repeat protein
MHPALYANGAINDLGSIFGSNGEAEAINASGQIVGWSGNPADPSHAFLYSEGVMTDLGPGDAKGINSSGEVVGSYRGGSGYDDVFLYSAGIRTDLNTLIPANTGWWDLGGGSLGINDGGQIVGTGINGPLRAYLVDTQVSSVPEPSSLALLSGGIALLVCVHRRKTRL